MSVITPNMNLEIPQGGDTDYPTSVSDSLTAVDGHDHSSGKGVQIPTAGLADGAVAGAKVADLGVTGAKLSANSVDAATIELNTALGVTSLRVKDSGISKAKLAALGQQVADTTSVAVSSATPADATGLTVTITTSGRPVFVALLPAPFDSLAPASISDISTASGSAKIDLVRDTTTIFRTVPITAPALNYVDVVGAGTYVYKIQASASSAASIQFDYCRLIAFEL